MRRFTKRLLTGILSGAMALSLVPATGFAGYEAKAAINPDLLPKDSESYILPGYEDWIGSWLYNVWNEEEGRNYETFITGAVVPDEYSDYVSVETSDEDGDGVLESVGFQTQFEMDDEGNVTNARAQGREDSVGKDIPVTVKYRLESGYNGELTHTIHIVDSIYECRNYTSIGASSLLPGQSYEAEMDVNHKVALWDDDNGWYYHKNKELENPTYEVKLDNPEDNRFTVTPGTGNKFTITARELEDGEDINDILGWAGITATLYENGVKTQEFGIGTSMEKSFYALLPDDFPGLKLLKVGSSINIKPQVIYYDVDTAPQGQVVEGAEFDFDYDENSVQITEESDGSYTIKRLDSRGTDFGFEAHYQDAEIPGRRPELLDLDEYYQLGIKADNDIFVVFSDTPARTFTLDTSKLDQIYSPDEYEIEWIVGNANRDEQGNYEKTYDESYGVTVAADGKSVTVDGRILASKLMTSDEQGNSFIQDDRATVEAVIKFDHEEEEPGDISIGTWEEFFVREAYARYDDLNLGDDSVYQTGIFPGDVLYLDNWYYEVKNEANPYGAFKPLDIVVNSITGYEWNDEPRDFTTVKPEMVNGRPALVAVTELPENADEQGGLFGGYNVVEFTYTDADGVEKTDCMRVDVEDFDARIVCDANVAGQYMADEDETGKWINTLCGTEVSGSVKAVVRQLDRETGKVTVSYPEFATLKFDKHGVDGDAAIKLNGNSFVITGNEAGGGVWGNFEGTVLHEWTDGEGNTEKDFRNVNFHLNVRYNDGLETPYELHLEDLNQLGTVEWTPVMISTRFDEEAGSFVTEETTDWHAYGFSYDPELVSVTANGKELLDGYTNDKVTITKKTDRVVKLKLVLYDQSYDGYVFRDNEQNLYADGVKRDVAHSDHDWSQKVVTRATIGKAGSLIKTCNVGGEQETEEIPAIKTISLNKTTLAYTGAKQTVKVTVKDTAGNVIPATEYTATNLTKTNAGTYKVVVTFKSAKYEGTKTLTYTIKKPVLKYRAYVQKKNWMTWQTAAISSTPSTKTMAGTTDDLRMETIQMQLSGVGGEIRYRAYCQKKGWVGVGTETGGWATTANKTTNAGTKGESRRVEMIQLQTKGEVSTLYDIYYQAYSEKFGWLAWAGNNEKAGSAGYAYKLEAFRVQLVPKGANFDKTKGAAKKKSFYDKTKDGANPK